MTLTPQQIIDLVMAESSERILLGFDLRRLVTQCIELGYIAGCDRSCEVIREVNGGDSYITDIRNDYMQRLGLKP